MNVSICYWVMFDDELGCDWETRCNNAFSFNEGGPVENGFLYCPFCGAKISELTQKDLETHIQDSAPQIG